MENMEENLDPIVKNDAGEVVGEHFGLEDKDLKIEQEDIEQMSEADLEGKIQTLNEELFHLPKDKKEKRDELIEQINVLDEELGKKQSVTPAA